MQARGLGVPGQRDVGLVAAADRDRLGGLARARRSAGGRRRRGTGGTARRDPAPPGAPRALRVSDCRALRGTPWVARTLRRPTACRQVRATCAQPPHGVIQRTKLRVDWRVNQPEGLARVGALGNRGIRGHCMRTGGRRRHAGPRNRIRALRGLLRQGRRQGPRALRAHGRERQRQRARQPRPGRAGRRDVRRRGRRRGPGGQGRRLRAPGRAPRRRRRAGHDDLLAADRRAGAGERAPRALRRPARVQPGAEDGADRARVPGRGDGRHARARARAVRGAGQDRGRGARTRRASSSTACCSRSCSRPCG